MNKYKIFTSEEQEGYINFKSELDLLELTQKALRDGYIIGDNKISIFTNQICLIEKKEDTTYQKQVGGPF